MRDPFDDLVDRFFHDDTTYVADADGDGGTVYVTDAIVASYTDSQAILDGALINVQPLGLRINGRTLNRLTNTLRAALTPKVDAAMQGQADPTEAAQAAALGTVLGALAGAAVDDDGDEYLLKTENATPDGGTVWFILNDLGGYTAMLPSDY